MLAYIPLLAAVTWQWIVGGIVIIVGFIAIAVLMQFFSLWLQAYMSKASVGFTDLIGQRLRKVNSTVIVHSKIQLVKAGLLPSLYMPPP